MKALTTSNALKEQRESLCLQLQQNRRIMSHALVDGAGEFPRSFTMRLLTQKKAAVGLRLFRVVAGGFSFLSLMKRRLARTSYIEHSKAG